MNNRIVKFRVYKDDKLQYPVRPGGSKEGDLREIFFDSDEWVEERHGVNGWVAKTIKETCKSTRDSLGKIVSICDKIKEYNYGGCGLEAYRVQVVGNIFENQELL